MSDDFGIVSKEDLEEEERFARSETFPPTLPSFRYWQCLPTAQVLTKCESLNINAPEIEGKVGDPTFQITTKSEIYNFYTSHNYSIEDCKEMVGKWRSVMGGEKVVCISASYIGSKKQVTVGGNVVKSSQWEIARMKSHHDEWSWFERAKASVSSRR